VRGFQFRSIWVQARRRDVRHRALPAPADAVRPVRLPDRRQQVLPGQRRVPRAARWRSGCSLVDAGNVYADYQSIDVGRLRYSGGAELRIFVPMFGAPLRFIYAKNLRPLKDDKFQSFQFSIGATF
jgi:hypothetical protein